MRVQGRQAQILWFWATSKMLTPRSRPWRTSLKRVSVRARPHKQSHDIGGLMDRSSRELGRHQKRSVSMLWSGAKLRGHCWSTRATSPPATVSLSRRWSLLPCFSPPEHSFWHCCHFSSRGLLLLRLELFGYCGRRCPSCTSVPCSNSAGTTDTYCDSSASRRKRDAVLMQGRWTRFQMVDVCLASRRTSQTLPGQWPQVHITRFCPATKCTVQTAGVVQGQQAIEAMATHVGKIIHRGPTA